MLPIHTDAIRTEELDLPWLTAAHLQADVLRLDTIHTQVSGNKWFKLRFHIEAALAENKTGIVTWGGAWSNHIIATAAACNLYGLKSYGIIRGERPANPSDTLQEAAAMGMELFFTSREEYRSGYKPLALCRDDLYGIPAGGYSQAGARGAATILDHCNKENYTHVCCAVGTGTMAAGLLQALPPAATLVAVSAMKNNPELETSITTLVGQHASALKLVHDFHFGGYARYTTDLLEFMNTFYRETRIPLDFVYTGKLFFAIRSLAGQGYFPEGSSLLLVHSGGLQGNASLGKGTLIF